MAKMGQNCPKLPKIVQKYQNWKVTSATVFSTLWSGHQLDEISECSTKNSLPINPAHCAPVLCVFADCGQISINSKNSPFCLVYVTPHIHCVSHFALRIFSPPNLPQSAGFMCIYRKFWPLKRIACLWGHRKIQKIL